MFREKIENAGAAFIACDGYDFEMEDKENADCVGEDQAFAVELLVSSTLALDQMTTAKIAEIQPDLIVSDSIAYWGKLAAMKHGIPYISSTATFAFNRYSSRYMKHGIGETLKMLFSMPKVNTEKYHFIGPSIRPSAEKYEKKADKTVYISMYSGSSRPNP